MEHNEEGAKYPFLHFMSGDRAYIVISSFPFLTSAQQPVRLLLHMGPVTQESFFFFLELEMDSWSSASSLVSSILSALVTCEKKWFRNGIHAG